MKEINDIVFEKNALNQLTNYLKDYSKIFILTSPTPKKYYFQFLANLLSEQNLNFWSYTLNSNSACTSDNVLKTCSKIKSAEIIVAFGAGTVFDIAKIASKNLNLPLLIVPTTITHFGMFTNYAILNDHVPQVVETPAPKKIFIDKNFISKSPETFIYSTICFSISNLEYVISSNLDDFISNQSNQMDCIYNLIKKITDLLTWLSLCKDIAIINLLEYVIQLYDLCKLKKISNSMFLANLIKSSTLKNNFGEKCLLCSSILLKLYYEFFNQNLIYPISTPEIDKIITIFEKKPYLSVYFKNENYHQYIFNYLKSTNFLLNNEIKNKLQNYRFQFLNKTLEYEMFISKFIKKYKIMNKITQFDRMIDEKDIFYNLEILPILTKNNSLSLLSRYGFLNMA